MNIFQKNTDEHHLGKGNFILKIITCAMILGTTFGVNCWTLKEDMYFLFDDIYWIYNAKFNFDLGSFFTVLPTERYNDRPLRDLFFYCLYKAFGMNYTAYYFVVILFHIITVLLVGICVFMIADRLRARYPFWLAAIISMWFGIYPKNLMAVFWIAGAANDLLCTFFALISGLFFLLYLKESSYKRWINMGFCCVFYMLGLRSKEAVICLPLIFVLYELFEHYYLEKKPYVKIVSFLPAIYMGIYLIRIFTFPTIAGGTQYEQKISLQVIWNVLLNYIRMYFGLDDPNFSYDLNNYYTKTGKWGIVLIFGMLFLHLILLQSKKHREKNIGVLLLFSCIGCAMAPLLILPNVQHLLYFYFPALFISALCGMEIYFLLAFAKKYVIHMIGILLLLCALIGTNQLYGPSTLRRFWYSWGAEARLAAENIQNIDVPSGTNVYVKLPEGVNIFFYGPGYILPILKEDLSIKYHVYEDEKSLEEPYTVWTYLNGTITTE